MKNVYVALENLRSLYNIGAIFRTCSFFGLDKVVLIGYTGKRALPGGKTLLHEKIAKSALGSENHLQVIFLESPQELIIFAKENRLKIISIEQNENSVSLEKWVPEDNCVLILGNEVTGISKYLLQNSDKIIEISRYGKHNSLNVATTCGIVLHYCSGALVNK